MLELIVTILGLLMVSSYFPQAYKIIKRRSSADVSLISYIMLLVGGIAWQVYGFTLENLPLIITNTVAMIGCVLVIVVWFKYST